MPQSAIISQAEKEKINQWLMKDKGPLALCSGCGHPNFSLAEHFIQLPVFPGGMFAGKTYAGILLICDRCGLFRIYSAVVMGLIPSSLIAEQDKTVAKDG